MPFEPIKHILAHSIKISPLAAQLQIARVFDAWQHVLQKLWGTERAALVSPISLREGVLKLATTSPAAKQQLSVEKVKLQNAVNRQLGEQVVRSIVVQARGF